MTSPSLAEGETLAKKLEEFATINDSYPSDMEIQSGACFGTLTLGDVFQAAAFIRSQASTIEALEAERDEARETLKYCEGKWSDERGTMIDKFTLERKRALAAESALTTSRAEVERLREALPEIVERLTFLARRPDKHGCVTIHHTWLLALADKLDARRSTGEAA